MNNLLDILRITNWDIKNIIWSIKKTKWNLFWSQIYIIWSIKKTKWSLFWSRIYMFRSSNIRIIWESNSCKYEGA